MTNDTTRPSREYLLTAMRSGRWRIHLLLAELDEIGVLLKEYRLDVQDAINWLEFIGAIPFVSPSTGDDWAEERLATVRAEAAETLRTAARDAYRAVEAS